MSTRGDGNAGRGVRVRSALQRPERVAALLLLLLPGALTVYLGFSAGGFFAGTTGAAAVIAAVALVLRLTLADDPLRSIGKGALMAATGLAGLCVWTLLSQSWSDAPARAVIEFDRTLLYVLVLALFATVGCTARRLSVALWGFAAAVVVLCIAGLMSRVLPDLVSAPPDIEADRLSWPLTYWNALGLLATLGIVACTHLATSERQPAAARIAGAAALPGLAVTLYFTFSRGSIAVAILAVIIYLVLAHPRGLPAGLLAAVPATGVAVAVAYNADLLASETPTAEAAASQGSRVALVTALAMVAAGGLRALLLALDRRLARVQLPARPRRAVLTAGAAAILVLGVVGAVALDAPATIDRQYDRFLEGNTVRDRGDLRERLIDPGNNGRLDGWRVAMDGYRAERLHGGGAGTYELLWARQRPSQFTVVDAHSLYLETLSDLGLVGAALLGLALLTILAGLVRRTRGPDRALFAALTTMMLAWLVHAGIDWDWEMPAVTLWLLAFGGLALGRPPDGRRALGRPGRVPRVVLGLAAALLAVTPALVYLSQRQLDRSVRDFRRGDCGGAIDAALASNRVLSVRPEPLEILAYCDVRIGRPKLGLQAMKQAVERDPRSWQLHYGLALVQAAGGLDPRASARRALVLNPKEPLADAAVKLFRTDDPAKWKRRALRARLPIR